jgi:hypothetical protein
MNKFKYVLVLGLIFILGSIRVAHADTEIDGSAMTSSSFTFTGLVYISSLTANTISASSLSVSTITTVSSGTISNLTVGNQLNAPNSSYGRPSLLWNSTTQVQVVDHSNAGTNAVKVCFSDGSCRICTSNSCQQMTITQNAVLSGTFRGGMAPGETVASNTWYGVYDCKVTSDQSNYITIATTNVPVAANINNLNAICGTNGYTYIGLIRYGDGAVTNNAILAFDQAGAMTLFRNSVACHGGTSYGFVLATTAAASSLTWNYSSGTGAAQVPGNVSLGYMGYTAMTSNGIDALDASGSIRLWYMGSDGVNGSTARWWQNLSIGLLVEATAGSNAYSILMFGFYDNALGVGPNPIL